MRVLELETTLADGTKTNGNIVWDGQSTSVPENQFSLRLDYRLTDAVNLWSMGYYSTGHEAVDADGAVVERDGFVRLDLGAGYAFPANWVVRTRVENQPARAEAAGGGKEGSAASRSVWRTRNLK